QRELDFIRGKEKLASSPIKAEGYSSPLDQDVMRVKGGTEHINPNREIGRIKGVTEHINTKGVQKIGNAADVMKVNADKIARMKALRKLGSTMPAMGAITALGTGLMSDDVSASEIASNVAQEVIGDLPVVGQAYDA